MEGMTPAYAGLEDNTTAAFKLFTEDHRAALGLTLGASAGQISIQSVVPPDQSSRRLLQVQTCHY